MNLIQPVFHGVAVQIHRLGGFCDATVRVKIIERQCPEKTFRVGQLFQRFDGGVKYLLLRILRGKKLRAVGDKEQIRVAQTGLFRENLFCLYVETFVQPKHRFHLMILRGQPCGRAGCSSDEFAEVREKRRMGGRVGIKLQEDYKIVIIRVEQGRITVLLYKI